MTHQSRQDASIIRAARLRRADDLLTRDLCLRLATLDPAAGDMPGLTVAQAMGATT